MKNLNLNKLSALVLLCLALPMLAFAASPTASNITAKVIKDTQNSTLNLIKLQASDADTGDVLTYSILSLPTHGRLTDEAGQAIAAVPYNLSSNKLKYIPESGFFGSDSFTYKANDGTYDSNTATVSLNVVEWFPPIGIPEPTFGIKETYRMYDDPAKRNPALTYTQNAEGGFYTHYVDNDHPGSTDSSNPYGSTSTPRRTIPNTLPVGSVVEIRNSIGETGTRYKVIEGTAALPVFVRGYAANDPPTVNASFVIKGPYTIWENLKIQGAFQVRPHDGSNAHHVAVRRSELWNTGEIGAGTGVGIWGTTGNRFHNVVVYGNHIHHGGDSEATVENDNHGVNVGTQTEDVWVVDNHIHHMGGDAFQAAHGANFTTYRLYVGRNVMHEDRENAVDLKQANQVIVSENEVWGYRPRSSSFGEAMVVHYDPSHIYWINNTIYDSTFGIVSTGSSNQYIIGNVIYNITGGGSYTYPYSPHRRGIGIRWYNTGATYVIGNTIVGANIGIGADLLSYATTIENNIVTDVNAVDGYHISIQGTGASASVMTHNLLYQEGKNAPIYWRGIYDGLAAFQSGTGKGENCLEEAPLFTNAGSSVFTLQSGSPAINAGIESEVYQRFYDLYGINIRKDIEGRTRPQGSAWDIGAYEYVPSQGEVLYGDVSGDAEVSAYDAALTAQAAVGLITLTAEQTQKADVSGDAEVSAYDAALIAQRAVGLIDRFPVEG